MNRSTLALCIVTIALLVSTGCATTNTARYGENCIVQRTTSFGTLRIGSQRDVYCTTFTGAQGGGWNTGYPMMGGGVPVNIPPANGQFGSQPPVMMTGGWGGTVGSEYMWSAPSAYYRRGYTDGREIEEAERRAEEARREEEVRRPAPAPVRQTAPAAPPPDPPPTRSAPVKTEAELEAERQRALEWLRTYNGGE